MVGKQQEKKSIPWVMIILLIGLVGGAVYVVNAVLSEDVPRRKDNTATVTLLKPPPPVQIKEKLPEPEQVKEIPKKEAIIDPGPQNNQQNTNNDSPPAGDKLGLDADGGAGADGFGLVGRKGGRSLLEGGGGLGKMSLLSRFAGYTQVVTNQVKKKVLKRLEEDGGIPKGKLQAVVRLTVNSNGDVVASRIIGSSGNNRMDDAIKNALSAMMISEPPPDGMPRTMDIKITSQG